MVLTDAQRAALAPLVEQCRPRGKTPHHDLLPRVPLWVVGDRGYGSHELRERVRSAGARPAIPTRSDEVPVACPAWIYDDRDLVERLWARLKEWHAVATRYEKTAASFLGVLQGWRAAMLPA